MTTRHPARLIVPVLAAVLFARIFTGTGAAATGPNLVVNGSFESPAVAEGAFGYLASIPGWSRTSANAIELLRNYPGVGPAAAGGQYAELDSDAADPGAAPGIFQDLDTTPGTVYLLRFAFSPRPGKGADQNVLRVSWGGDVIATFTADGTGRSTTAWVYHERVVVGGAGSTTRLAFRSGGPIDGAGTLLDDVSVVARECRSLRTGDWGDAGAWDCGAVPGAGNDVKIQAGHTVSLDRLGTARTLTIALSATLRGLANTLELEGDWIQDGAFLPGTSTVRFKGDGKQQITGGALTTQFHRLVVDKAPSTGVPATDDARDLEVESGKLVETRELLRILSGQIRLDNSKHQDVLIEALGAYKSRVGKDHEVTGDWTQHGKFAHGQSTITHLGGATQVTGGSAALLFYDLKISKQVGTMSTCSASSMTVAGKTSVISGTFQGCSTYQDVEIGAEGTLLAKEGGTIRVKGHWTNDGVFTPGKGHAVFEGEAAQDIDGKEETEFHNLTIVSAGGLTLRQSIAVQGTLTVVTRVTLASGMGTPVYLFRGFFPPVENRPALNEARAGQAVPLHFSLRGDRGLEIFAAGFPGSRRVPCDTLAGPGSLAAIDTPGNSDLSYDAATDTYTYVWQTDRAWAGTCRQLVVRLANGRTRVVTFSFR